MSGLGESHSEKVDICVYSSNSGRMGSSPPPPRQSLSRLSGNTMNLNRLLLSKRPARKTAHIHRNIYTPGSMHSVFMSKARSLLRSRPCKLIFLLLLTTTFQPTGGADLHDKQWYYEQDIKGCAAAAAGTSVQPNAVKNNSSATNSTLINETFTFRWPLKRWCIILDGFFMLTMLTSLRRIVL